MAYKDVLPDELSLRDCLARDRTVLANERTLLAFIRTGLMLVATGVTVFKLIPDGGALVVGVSWLMGVVGGATLLYGTRRYLTVRRNLRQIR